ncbi:MAG: protein kinase [Byssovorax sp.]
MSRFEARFALETRVGRGAYGEVFRARDRETGQLVAVKRLHEGLSDETALERFLREARLLSILDDPHVVRYVAHGEDEEGRHLLAVEWLEGEDVGQRQQRARLSLSEVIEVARQSALGLHALHEAGIVHRDVKPSNLFLARTDDGTIRVKLIDLSVARAGAEATLTTGTVALGTPFYMSPEQARGRDRVTARSDLFSLGVVLFELCAGKRPFTGDHLFAILAKIVLQEPPRLRDALPGAPPALDALVARAMAKRPDDRFASAWEMAQALAALPEVDRRLAPVDPSIEAPTVGISALPVTAGEQRVITALFAALPRAGSGEGAAELFSTVIEAQGGAAHATLDRHAIGVFGGARSTGDEALRAARAALLLAARVPGARLSIVTGRALSGLAGLSGEAIERGAIELDEASESGESASSAPAAIHLDEASALLLAEHFQIDRRGAHRVLSGVRGGVAPPRTLAGRVTPCVGRDRELSILEATFAECSADSVARAVLLTGPSGIGKSRIRYELLGRLGLGSAPPTVLFGRGDPFGADAAHALLAPAIRRVLGVSDGDPADVQRARLVERLRLTFAEADAQRIAPGLGELCGLPFPQSGSAAPLPDPVLAGDRMRAAFLEWLDAECRARPLLLVVEDLQWGDLPSVGLIDAALRVLADRPLMVMALGRPEVHERFPRLWAQRSVQEIPIGALGAKAVERLARVALGKDVDASTVELVVGRAEGNAFYAEELIFAIAQGHRDRLPDTVLGMVQARLDTLGALPKRLLRAASVFGPTFWSGGLAATLDLPPEVIEEALEQLVLAELIARRADAGPGLGVEHGFRNALVREAAYAMLTAGDRALYHRRAASFLEQAGRVDPAALAQHFERGGDPSGAIRFHLEAAERALSGNDLVGALACAERALSAGAAGPERGAARLIQAEARRFRAELAEAEAAGEEALGLLEAGSFAWFQAAREVIAAAGRRGRIERVRHWVAEAAAARPAPGAEGAQVACLVPAAVHFVYAGHLDAAAWASARIDALVAAGPPLGPLVQARLHQLAAIRAQHAEDLETALREQQAALARFQEGSDLRNACLTLSNLAFMHGELGNLAEAEGALRRAHESAERMGLSTIAPLCLHNLGGVLGSLGRLDEARAVEARAVAAFQAQGDPRLEAASRVYLARIHQLTGDFPAAEAEARFVAESEGAPAPLRAGARAALSQALLTAGKTDEALLAAEQAASTRAQIGPIEDFDMLILVAHAEALEAAGRREQARASVEGALDQLRKKAARIRDDAQRARFLHAVPDNRRCVELGLRWGIR